MGKPRCDVDGCTHTRFRWQRICARCFATLPYAVSLPLIAAGRAGDRPTMRRLSKEAGRILADSLARQDRL